MGMETIDSSPMAISTPAAVAVALEVESIGIGVADEEESILHNRLSSTKSTSFPALPLVLAAALLLLVSWI